MARKTQQRQQRLFPVLALQASYDRALKVVGLNPNGITK